MKVAILGFGTVGVGVYEMLEKTPGLAPGPVLVRAGKVDAPYKTDDLDTIVSDPSVWAVCECMGGVEPAFSYAAAVLKAGKHLVTSNKALVAAKGPELAALAKESGAGFLFSAACGGAIPFLHNLQLAAESDSIQSLGGILNGTTNFMLDAMQTLGVDYADALREAQALGYAEADPTADVSGMDALRKIMLGCATAYNLLPTEGLCREGIESLTAADVKDLQARQLVCRLLGRAGLTDSGKLFAYIQPVLVPDTAPEAAVRKNFNLAYYVGKNAGLIRLMGQGAGRYPTASALLRDVCDLGRGTRRMMRADCQRVEADNSLPVCRYYVRLPKDKADALCFESLIEDGEVVRGITGSVPVSRMHAIAEKIRGEGCKLFFAALED